jgi:GNAT superfamily N-acetyltransferase
VATFALQTIKPWSIDRTLYAPCRRPLYLTAMAVHPDEQGKGIGRECLGEALRIAKEWPADSLRLDAFDADAGAGGFYSKCGFREVGRGCYRTVPHIYFEAVP